MDHTYIQIIHTYIQIIYTDHTRVQIYIHAYIHTYIHMDYTYIQIIHTYRSYIHAHIHAYIHTYQHAHIQYIHTHTYAYMHTYIRYKYYRCSYPSACTCKRLGAACWATFLFTEPDTCPPIIVTTAPDCKYVCMCACVNVNRKQIFVRCPKIIMYGIRAHVYVCLCV